MRIPTFTHSELLESLSYDPMTGVFLWKQTRRRTEIGKPAGTTDFYGRRIICKDKQRYFAHRLAWFYVHGEFPDKDIDHINGDHSDNRISNLRLATHAENMQNHRKARSDSKSGLAGVYKAPGKRLGWYAEIRTNGKKTYIGYFETKELAHNAYLQEKRRQHPFCTV